jgi:EAL domain-containing protein (putative c-di-GMP-specific phosphodiesterase class I)
VSNWCSTISHECKATLARSSAWKRWCVGFIRRLGLIAPNDFIPMAEATGLIVPLGAEVVRMACEQMALWKAQNLRVVPVSVNVSAQQIDTGTVSAMLAAP